MLCSVKPCYKAAKKIVTVSADLFIMLAVAVLLVPIQWLAAWILALSVHELCHYLAIRICGGNITGIRITCRGIIMDAEPLPLGKEALCAYAGPVGALVVLVAARYVPRTAICTLCFSAYNLLPIFPLDGGRGLGCILKKFLSDSAAIRVLGYIENIVLLGIVSIAAISVFYLGLGLLPAAAAALLFWRNKGLKSPCKKRRLGLQ